MGWAGSLSLTHIPSPAIILLSYRAGGRRCVVHVEEPSISLRRTGIFMLRSLASQDYWGPWCLLYSPGPSHRDCLEIYLWIF